MCRSDGARHLILLRAKRTRGRHRPRDYDSPDYGDDGYLFLDDFLLPPFFAPPDLPPFFEAIQRSPPFMPYGTSRSRLLGKKRRIAPASLHSQYGGGIGETNIDDHQLILKIVSSFGRSSLSCRKYAMNKRYCQAFVYENRNRNAVFHARFTSARRRRMRCA